MCLMSLASTRLQHLSKQLHFCAAQALEKLTHLYSVKQAKLQGLGMRTKEDLRQQFVAELSVKKILLGLGTRESLQQYALQQPVWATGGSRSAALCT